MLSIFSCVCWQSVYLLWRNVYLGFLPIFWLSLFFLILCCMSCLYILEINLLSVASFENIFSQSVGCFFVLFKIRHYILKWGISAYCIDKVLSTLHLIQSKILRSCSVKSLVLDWQIPMRLFFFGLYVKMYNLKIYNKIKNGYHLFIYFYIFIRV